MTYYLEGGAITTYNNWEDFDLSYGTSSAVPIDKNKIYISGGVPGNCGGGTGGGTTTVEAYVSNIGSILNGVTLERIADMEHDRQTHAMIGTSDGNFIVLAGVEGEYYIQGENYWYRLDY